MRENFSADRLEIKFVSREDNKGVNTLSRWGVRGFGGHVDGASESEKRKAKVDKSEENLEVQPYVFVGEGI